MPKSLQGQYYFKGEAKVDRHTRYWTYLKPWQSSVVVAKAWTGSLGPAAQRSLSPAEVSSVQRAGPRGGGKVGLRLRKITPQGPPTPAAKAGRRNAAPAPGTKGKAQATLHSGALAQAVVHLVLLSVCTCGAGCPPPPPAVGPLLCGLSCALLTVTIALKGERSTGGIWFEALGSTLYATDPVIHTE
ncbi:hypothetical protein QTO34_018039 [Cnephaeus nilssonii]|uniref:Uncharacterized protein n=1 Tax=Cnephaeus nilssonii TaxID=3371016 RepID=A0AA40LS38_CNENI|nr:hypothetical protein QTO34_018039 [Eptesicus nilssonii]